MNITRNQWLVIVGVVLSAIVVSTSYFTDMFGAQVAKDIVGTAAFLNMILGGITYALTGQGQQIADVRSMKGVEKIYVNEDANATLAKLATNPDEPKIGPIPAAKEAVTETAARG